jgi:membrane dipeptidase
VYYSLSERHGVRLVERRGDLAYPGLKFLLVLEGADVLSSVDDLRLMYRLGARGVGVT